MEKFRSYVGFNKISKELFALKRTALNLLVFVVSVSISCNEIYSNPSSSYSHEHNYDHEINLIKKFYETGLDVVVENLEMISTERF